MFALVYRNNAWLTVLAGYWQHLLREQLETVQPARLQPLRQQVWYNTTVSSNLTSHVLFYSLSLIVSPLRDLALAVAALSFNQWFTKIYCKELKLVRSLHLCVWPSLLLYTVRNGKRIFEIDFWVLSPTQILQFWKRFTNFWSFVEIIYFSSLNNLRGVVRPKKKMKSLSIHPHTDWRPGLVF